MSLPVCLRLRCACCAWRNVFEPQINTDNPSRDLLGRNAWFFRYTEPSDENECNFNEINSTNSE